MSWMKLNEGLSSLKGQISNFASNVLADDEDSEVITSELEKLKQLCVQQKLEIVNLKTINDQLQNKTKLNQSQENDAVVSNGSWNWESQDDKPSTNNHEDPISDLKKRVASLEIERNDALAQIEQLDSENQENLSKVVAMKEKLQDELNDLKEDYEKLRLVNKNLVAREEKLKSEAMDLRGKQNTDDNKQTLEGLAEENQKLRSELEESEKQRKVLDSSNATLQKVFEDFKLASEDEIARVEGANKMLAGHLQNAKEKIQVFEKKSLEDEDNCHKLAVILETYEKQVSMLKEEVERLKGESQCSKVEETKKQLKLVTAELEELKTQKSRSTEEVTNLQDLENDLQALRIENSDLRRHNEDLQRKVNSSMDADLEEELERINEDHVAQLNILEQEIEQLRSNDCKNIVDEEQVHELEDCIKTLRIEISDLEEQNKELAATHERVMKELHDQYVNIITENIKKFQDCEKLSDFKNCSDEDDAQVADFSKQVENIMKILLDLKCKCQTLESKVMELSEEKTNILSEKNHEIEKLMHNSEILSQEVLRKTQEIKEYEKECSELAANNDLLIADLEAYKNNSVLQTISESNEDNMVLLESQLENANRRIEDLEKIIDDYDKEKLEKNRLEQEEAVQHSISTDDDTLKKASDYQDLLSSFDNLQVEHDALKCDLEASRDYLESVNHEKSELKSSFDKVTSDYDNLEYQISELNVNNDSMKEEMSIYKNEVDNLLKENSKLKFLAEEYKDTNDELKSRLDSMKKKLAEEENEKVALELQVRTFTEKLQISKMAETSLKLHCEQKSKEVAALSEANYNLELSLKQTNANLAQFQTNFAELQSLNDTLSKEIEELIAADKARQEQIQNFEELVKDLREKLERSEASATSHLNLENTKPPEDPDGEQHNIQMETQLTETLNKCSQLQHQLQEISNSRNELINLVTTKHQESITYHNEIQRLTQILTTESEKYRNLEAQFGELQTKLASEDIDALKRELDKLTDQNGFLREKCEVLAKNLLEEQSKAQQLAAEKSSPTEKEVALQKNLDRLQRHLAELEEHHTQELFQAEQKNAALQARVADIEEREKNSSNMYTSVSIRANQQVESLQKQLQVVAGERDGLRRQVSEAEDRNTEQAAALANLQYVLEQFRKDKEKDVHVETERIRRQIAVEKQVQGELRKEIASLKGQLEESNQGLLAASRLSDQLENTKRTVSALRDEATQLQTKLSKAEADLRAASTHTNEKVDKSLIKNLLIGFVTSNNNLNKDQSQILKIMATVLDFNQQDHDKVSLHRPPQGGSSWLGSLLGPGGSPAESLSRAFVRFLESESQPRAVPDLLGVKEGGETKSGQAPVVLSEIVLPTFADFAQNRNSSSILKDVLKDNS